MLPFATARRGARVDGGAGFNIVGYAAHPDRLDRNCDLIYVASSRCDLGSKIRTG
jgi:hypothetical protein